MFDRVTLHFRTFVYVLLSALCAVAGAAPEVAAAEWQWSVTVPSITSAETEEHPQAFLWIPSDCRQVKAVVVGQHNMCEETLFENPVFRRKMQEAGIALVWICLLYTSPSPRDRG